MQPGKSFGEFMLRLTLILTLVAFSGAARAEIPVQPVNQEWVQVQSPHQQGKCCNFRSYINRTPLSNFWETINDPSYGIILNFNIKELTSFKSQNNLYFFRENSLKNRLLKGIYLFQTDDFYHARQG